MLVVDHKTLGACVSGTESSLAQTVTSKGSWRRKGSPRLDKGVEVPNSLFGVLGGEFFEGKVLGQSDWRGCQFEGFHFVLHEVVVKGSKLRFLYNGGCNSFYHLLGMK